MEWGKEIEVNGVRPAWLADEVRVPAKGPAGWYFGGEIPQHLPTDSAVWKHVEAIRLPVDHFAYLAIERGFEPWNGQSKTAPADWDEGDVLRRGGYAERRYPWIAGLHCNERWHWLDHFFAGNDIIGYRKRATPPREETTLDEVLRRLTDGVFYDDHDWASGPALRAVKRAIHAEREAEQQDASDLDALIGDFYQRFGEAVSKGDPIDANGKHAAVLNLLGSPDDYAVVRRLTTEEIAAGRKAYFASDSKSGESALFYARYWGIAATPTPLDRFMDAHPDADRATAEQVLAWQG